MSETSPNYGALHIELLLSCPAKEITIFQSFIRIAHRVVIVADCSLVEEICESLDIRSKVDIWLKRFEACIFSRPCYLDFATVERKTKEPAADVSRTSNG